MANVLKVNEQNSIQQLVTQGWSRRRIARELNLDRKTVRRYLEAAAKSPTISTAGSPEPPESKSPISTPGEKGDVGLPMAMLEVEAGRPSLCDPHRQCIDCKLDAGPSVAGRGAARGGDPGRFWHGGSSRRCPGPSSALGLARDP